MRSLILCLTAVCFAVPASAADQAAPPQQMDMTKVGPPSRKPKDEKAVKKQVESFFKEEQELMKKGDFDAMLARVDFPAYLVTDDSKGVPMAKLYTREEYIAQMKPYWENMPKDMKIKNKPTYTVLSDSLVTMVDDYTMEMGKQKVSGRSESLLIKKDGQWKWKMMVEAGWGDVATTKPADAAMPPADSQPAMPSQPQGQQGPGQKKK